MAVGGGKRGQGRSCSSNYPNNMQSWAIYGPFDLSNASSAVLTFNFQGKTEGTQDQPIDYLFVGASTDDVNFSPEIRNIGGDLLTNGPYFASIPLDANAQVNMLGQSQVWISFIFNSDSSRTNLGITIDNLALDVQYNSSVTDTPTASPTPQSSATPTTTPATPTNTPSVATATPPTTTPQRTPVPVPDSRIIHIPIIAASPAACPAVSGQNDPAAATLLASAGQPCIGTSKTALDSEYHWYYVNSGAGQTLTVDLSSIPSGGDYDIYLYDKQILQTLDLASSLARSTKDLNADEHFTFAAPAAGRYYLLVFLRTKSTSAPNTYALKAQLQ